MDKSINRESTYVYTVYTVYTVYPQVFSLEENIVKYFLFGTFIGCCTLIVILNSHRDLNSYSISFLLLILASDPHSTLPKRSDNLPYVAKYTLWPECEVDWNTD